MSDGRRNPAYEEWRTTPLATPKKPASLRSVPEEEAATREELVAAIDGLTPEDWLRLRSFARFRMGAVAPLQAKGRTDEDLLREAIARAATGDRRWRRSVPFHQFLFGAMRSISTAWREEANPDLAVQLDARRELALVEGPAPAVAEGCDPVRPLVANAVITAMKNHFATDALVLVVIDALIDGMTAPEIASALGENLLTINAAIKKLRRHARELYPDWRAL